MSVNNPTSTSALPTPIRANSTSAAGLLGAIASRTRGSPHVATPVPNHAARRRFPTYIRAKREPSTAPAPTAAVSVPTPGSPMPSRSTAMSTVNTDSAPRVSV